MNEARRVALSALVLLVVCGAAVGHRIHWSSQLGHAVHPVAGAYSEANAYRAALNYLRDGLLARAGLPKIHGPELREHGAMASLLPDAPIPDQAYTHYPAGPDLTLALLVKIFGPGQMPRYRWFPIALAAASVFALGMSLVGWGAGPVRVGILAAAMFAVPAFGRWMPALHYHSYAVSLLCFAVALQLHLLKRRSELGDPVSAAKIWWPFLLLGFGQGALSFDFFFLACLAPLPIWMFARRLRPELGAAGWLFPVVLLGAGFVAAHALHFLQVCIHFGGVEAAVDDLFGAAIHRATGNQDGSVPDWLMGPVTATAHYLSVVFERGYLFRFDLIGIVLAVLLSAALLRSILGDELLAGGRSWLCLRVDGQTWLMFGSAFGVSMLWHVVMRQHAMAHWWFVGRHFLLFYLVALLYGLFVLLPLDRTARAPDDAEPHSIRWVAAAISTLLLAALLIERQFFPLGDAIVDRARLAESQRLLEVHDGGLVVESPRLVRAGEGFSLDLSLDGIFAPGDTFVLLLTAWAGEGSEPRLVSEISLAGAVLEPGHRYPIQQAVTIGFEPALVTLSCVRVAGENVTPMPLRHGGTNQRHIVVWDERLPNDSAPQG